MKAVQREANFFLYIPIYEALWERVHFSSLNVIKILRGKLQFFFSVLRVSNADLGFSTSLHSLQCTLQGALFTW